MAHLILGIDIGTTEIKAVLAEVSWRDVNVLATYVEPVPRPEDVAHRLPPMEAQVIASQAEDLAEDEADAGVPGAEPTPQPTETPPPWVFGLADLLKKHNLEYQEVHTSVPGAEVTTHFLTLPFDNRRRIEQILPFELENIVPFNLETMHVAFDVLGKAPEGGFKVMVCITPKENIKKFLGHLAQAGVDPKKVGVIPFSLYGAATLQLPEEQGAYALVDFGRHYTDLTLVNKGELLNLRSIPMGGAMLDEKLAKALIIDADRARELKETKADLRVDDKVAQVLRESLEPLLVRLRQVLQGARSQYGGEITRLYILGRGSLLRGLDDLLADELGVDVARFTSLPAGSPVNNSDDEQINQARFAAALAEVHSGVGPLRNMKLNLRLGEFFYRKQRTAMKASIRSAVVVGVVILALLLYNVVASNMQKRKYHQALSDQVVQIYLKAFPGVPPTQPLQQFQAQIGKTMDKYKTVGFLGEGDLRALDVIKQLSEAIPPDITVDIKKIDLTPDLLKFEGECNAFDDVDKIENVLAGLTGFKSVKKESSRSVSEKVKFKFSVHLTDRERSAAAGARTQPKAKTKTRTK